MPILSFSSRQIDLITGEKNMTIRKLWKKPLKVGDRLYCYWNLISKERQKVFEAEVTSVEIIKFKDLIKDDKLAQEDGFKDADELKREFERIYG
ncbi:MAG: ASCH domain-containing protein, partial [Methanobacteriales archaeon]|nr:ASCH domain-containing protein [Methanobacteriaceae archaeon]MBC7097457.1 ASCH domain-containing protein [Methanobacteriales archaeon]